MINENVAHLLKFLLQNPSSANYGLICIIKFIRSSEKKNKKILLIIIAVSPFHPSVLKYFVQKSSELTVMIKNITKAQINKADATGPLEV